jgi:hypothetical protein
LRLAACAARYERRTGRPIQYVLARVPDPSPRDWCYKETTVHVVAPADPSVEDLVVRLLRDDGRLWRPDDAEQLVEWRRRQARLHVDSAIETTAMDKRFIAQVSRIEVEDFRLVAHEGDARRYAFAGRAFSKNMAMPFYRRWTSVEGELDITFDRFGRVVAAEHEVE